LVTPAEVTWVIQNEARAFQATLAATYGQTWIDEQIPLMREYLCRYFSAQAGCSVALGNSLRPVGGTPDGGKLLKFRWAYPNQGKSGGLRILVACFCVERVVEIRDVDYRRNDPDFG